LQGSGQSYPVSGIQHRRFATGTLDLGCSRNPIPTSEIKKMTRPNSTIPAIACLVLVLLAAVLHLSMSVNHDAAWLLHGTRNLVDGGVYGKTVVDVNPPLAWWIATPAVVTQKLFGIKLGLAFKLYVLFLIGVSVAICDRLLQHRFVNSCFATASNAKYVFAAICVLIAGYDFGQREHFMAILGLPYIVLIGLRWLDWDRRGEEQVEDYEGSPQTLVLAASALGAIGFCIKPHFLAIPIAMELWLLAKTRRLTSLFRIEILTLFATGTIYLICVCIFAPEWLQKVMPQAMSNYGAYSQAMPDVAIAYGRLLLLPGSAVALLFFSSRTLIRPISTAFFIAGIGAAISATAQSKGWSYHILPAMLMWSVAAGLELTSVILETRNDARPNIIPTFAALLLVLISVLKPSVRLSQDRFSDRGNEMMVQNLARLIDDQPETDRSVFAFNTSPRVIHSAVIASEGEWIGTACCLHFLPAAVRSPNDEQLRKVAQVQMDEVMSMLEQSPSQVLVVDEGPGKLAFAGFEFDYLEWFRENYPQRFENFIAEYDQHESIGYFAVFVRKNAIASVER